MDDLSDDEEAILRFLRDQPRGQASHVQATHDNSYLRVQRREHTEGIREVLERLADRGYVQPLPGGFSSERTTYAYRLTEQGEQALRKLSESGSRRQQTRGERRPETREGEQDDSK